MKLFFHEIKEIDTDLDFTQDEPWVAEAIASCDEKVDSESDKPGLRTRPIRAHLNLRKVDDVVVVNGKVETTIQLVCSRCATPFGYELTPKFASLFCQDPEMAGIAHLAKDPMNRNDPGKPAGQTHGFARHAHDESLDTQEGFGKDLDITYIAGDTISLADLLVEQLRLEIPYQPLCKEDCKGICPQCGTDHNVGRCACAKIVKENAFSILKNWKN